MNSWSRRRQVAIVILLMLLAFVRAAIYAAVIPPWQAPDEPQHFEYVRLVHDLGRPVSWSDRSPELLKLLEASREDFHFYEFVPWASPNDPRGMLLTPVLYYRLAGFPLRWVSGTDLIEQLMTVRLVSALLAVAFVWVCYQTARILFPDDLFVQLGVPAFVVFLPMHTFISGAVNSDNLMMVVGGLCVLFITHMLQHGISPINAIGLVASVLLSYATKRTFVGLIPVALLAIPLTLWLHPPRKSVLRTLTLLGVLTVLTTGFVLWRLGISDIPTEWRDKVLLRLFSAYEMPDPGRMWQYLLQAFPDYVKSFFVTFWAAFGWGLVTVHPVWYLGLALLCGLVTLGAARVLLGRAHGFDHLQRSQLVILVLHVLIVTVFILLAISSALFLSTGTTEWLLPGSKPQGRHLFGALLPIAVLFTVGLRAWLPNDLQMQRLVLAVWVCGMFSIDLIWMVFRILPWFYA